MPMPKITSPKQLAVQPGAEQDTFTPTKLVKVAKLPQDVAGEVLTTPKVVR